jgi:hypothetical protein
MQGIPNWFVIGEPMIWTVIAKARRLTSAHSDVRVRVASECAAIHLAHCLHASVEENRSGHHSVAIGLIRQCVEAVTIVELGLIPSDIGLALVEKWKGAKTQGQLRQELARDIWPGYGKGLWNEPWGEYFGNLARAVQDYAHYSPALQGWQMVIEGDRRLREGAGGLLFGLMRYGFNTYDPGKATRVTLLHILLSWTVGRIINENKGTHPETQQIECLGRALAEADILGHGKLEWPHQFWANEFDGIERKDEA